jgi:hypothetical protein
VPPIVAWMTNPRTGPALDAWASGFIGYRSYGWPRGVQEEEPVHFSFRDPDDPVADDPHAEAEVIELESPVETISLERLR